MERFWSKVNKTETCWLWTATTFVSAHPARAGYGMFWLGGRFRRAHRVAWELTRGPIPRGKCVLHCCDVKACVNPDHLFLGTNSENNADRVSKGRSAAGEAHGITTLRWSDITLLRELYGTGNHSQRALARRFGVAQSTVGRIIRREVWDKPT